MIKRRDFIRNLAGLTALTAAGGYAIAASAEFTELEVVRRDVVSPRLPPGFCATIAFASDFHAGCPSVPPDVLARSVAQINGLRPDIVLLGGDYQIAKHYDPRTVFLPAEPVAEILGSLTAPGGVFGTLGNHDCDRGAARMGRALARNGICLLDNTTQVAALPGGQSLRLAGLPDYLCAWDGFDPANYSDPHDEPFVMVSHDPITATLFAPRQAILQLSGHTHGGQFVPPGLPPLYLPTSDTPADLVRGKARRNMMDIFVSSGIGTSTVTPRNISPEIVLVSLRGQALEIS